MAYQSNYTGNQIDAGIQKTTKMSTNGDDVTFAGKITLGSPPVNDMDAVNKAYLSNVSGITDEIKQALLNCFQKVAWVDDDGQTYYDALYDALYPPVGLDSITCVYTQSGTVYDTDTLDSLKSDLVVTAHYSDQSTQTITTYTLSGTLEEGTSTITVSYGGKSTTFDVTVSHASQTYLYNWDFTQSLTDSVQDMTLTLAGSATRDTSGLHLISTSDYVTLTGLNVDGYCFEIDIAEYDRKGSSHGRFFTIYQSGVASAGFIFHNGTGYNVWGIYSKADSAWNDTNLSYGALDGKTITIKIAKNPEDSNKKYMFVYMDGSLLVSGDMGGTTTNDAYLGSNNGQTTYNLTITGLRVYLEA